MQLSGKIERQIFKSVCFGADINSFDLDDQQKQITKKWITGRNCRFCHSEVAEADADVTITYWESLLSICHKSCKVEGEKSEVYDCQCIDAACNDCKHFQRGQAGILRWTGLGYTNVLTDIPGKCLKFGKDVITSPKSAECRPCFEHRKG